MTLRAVKAYVAQLAASTSLANTVWTNLNAYAQLPKPDPDGFRCVISIGEVRRHEERETGPRLTGIKELVYQLELLIYAGDEDTQAGGDGFDTLVENAIKVFRAATPGNPTLTDSATGEQSFITYIGETGDLTLLAPDLFSNPTRIEFRAIAMLEIREKITA